MENSIRKRRIASENGRRRVESDDGFRMRRERLERDDNIRNRAWCPKSNDSVRKRLSQPIKGNL